MEKRKIQARKNIVDMLGIWSRGTKKELYKLTQLSWRKNNKWSIRKKHTKKDLSRFTEILAYDILEVKLLSQSMADAYVYIKFSDDRLTGSYRIRFVSENKPYQASTSASFKFNPNSLRKID